MNTYKPLVFLYIPLILIATRPALAVDAPYSTWWVKPITRTEVMRVIHSTSSTPEQYAYLVRRTRYSHLDEVALQAFDQERKHRPHDLVFQSAFGLMYFNASDDARSGDYKPSNPSLQQRQLSDMSLLRTATDAVQQSVAGPGKNSWFCWFAIGESHFLGLHDLSGRGQEQNLMEQAKQELQEAVRLNPNSALVHTWLALSYQAEPEKSLQEAHRAIALDKTMASAYVYEARAYSALHDYKAALAAQTEAIVRTPATISIPASTYRELAYLKEKAQKGS